MSVHIGNLYHWSPTRNRGSIQASGLMINQPSNDEDDWNPPWICLATTPSSAWNLIPDTLISESWDLWQVQVGEGDQLRIRGDFSPFVREVRVHHGLSADRVWFVAERKEP